MSEFHKSIIKISECYPNMNKHKNNDIFYMIVYTDVDLSK